MSLVYLATVNAVVFRTLQMRADRAKAAAATPAEREPVEDNIAPTAIEAPISGTAGGGAAAPGISLPMIDVDSAIASTTGQGQAASPPPLEVVSKPSSSGRPAAGETFRFVEGISPNVPINTWSKCDHRRFKLRVGPNYDRNKQKAPSSTPLYEVFAMDVFCTDKRIDNVTSRMELPDTSDLNYSNPHVPRIFVVQLQLPSDPPPMLSTVEDGPGWSLVMYFKMTKETCDQLANIETASPAVKLFAKWCEKSDDPAWKSRFKVTILYRILVLVYICNSFILIR